MHVPTEVELAKRKDFAKLVRQGPSAQAITDAVSSEADLHALLGSRVLLAVDFPRAARDNVLAGLQTRFTAQPLHDAVLAGRCSPGLTYDSCDAPSPASAPLPLPRCPGIPGSPIQRAPTE